MCLELKSRQGVQKRWRKQLTYPKKSEKGRPWSLANAHVKRDTEARELNMATRPFQKSITISTVVAACDLVAPYRIWMIRYPVGVVNVVNGSPSVKRRRMTKPSWKTPFRTTLRTMLRGTFSMDLSLRHLAECISNQQDMEKTRKRC